MNLVDQEPMRPGWGRVWQGGEFAELDGIPEPFVVVSVVGALIHTKMNLSVFMFDTDAVTLPGDQLLAMTAAVLALLKMGANVYIHCWEGKYRSTYLDVAVHMAGLNYSRDQAFGNIKQSHPIAELRKGTSDQLARMESQIRGL